MRRLALAWRVLGALPWAEAAQAVLIAGGWWLITWGVASLLVWQIWPISGGILLLSIAGWAHLTTLFSAGVYALSRSTSKRGD